MVFIGQRMVSPNGHFVGRLRRSGCLQTIFVVTQRIRRGLVALLIHLNDLLRDGTKSSTWDDIAGKYVSCRWIEDCARIYPIPCTVCAKDYAGIEQGAEIAGQKCIGRHRDREAARG